MTATANMTCYIQPCTGFAQGAGVAWADTTKTATIRREVTSKAEAMAVLSEAREIAKALGGNMVIKTITSCGWGQKRPAGVKQLQGSEVVQ